MSSTLPPLPDSPKVKDLISAGTMLIKRHGYKRITVEEICETAQVSKMTFYKYFKNKKDIVLYILDSIFADMRSHFHDVISLPIPYAERIAQFVEYKLNSVIDDDFTFLEELLENADEEIRALMADAQAQAVNLQLETIAKAIENGDVHSWVTPELYVLTLNHLGSLVRDPLILSQFDGDWAEMSRFLTKFLMFGFVKQPPDGEKHA